MNICENMLDLVGNTPMVYLNSLTKGFAARVAAKLESYNPCFSVKDRIARYMVCKALEEGLLQPGGVVIEPTSGNTGIGLGLVCSVLGLKLILTMPESMSLERKRLLAAFGARLVLTPAEQGMSGAVARARQLMTDYPGAFMPMQFENKYNPEIHSQTTGEEIWRDTDGCIDIFVAGVGTGGTITGVGRTLRKYRPGVELVAVEPAASPVLSGGSPGAHKIQGIGAGFIPQVLDTSLLNEVLLVSNEQAISTARKMLQEEGILCGLSSGANCHAALQLAARPENEGKLIVFVVCDTGERYLSTDLFA